MGPQLGPLLLVAMVQSQDLPEIQPPALETSDGEPVDSAAMWRAKRRPEILQLFSEFVYGRSPGTEHIENFIQCMRSRKTPNAEIELGHRSTTLCHLGNISHRLGGRKLTFDAKTERCVNDADANALVKRTYRAPWVVPDVV